MKSEALRNIKTMRQIKTSLDVARCQKIKNTNSLYKTKEELESLEVVEDPKLNQILAMERKRFEKLESSMERSRQGLLKSRGRLAVLLNRNRALMKLRYELQQARSQDCSLVSRTPASSKNEKYNIVDLKY